MQFFKRSQSTFEITLSKIFPAGFAWQAAAISMNILHIPSTSLYFALGTGICDGMGVLYGHRLWTKWKKKYDATINIEREKKVSRWLGTAAFMSGTMWQPTVNLCNFFFLDCSLSVLPY